MAVRINPTGATGLAALRPIQDGRGIVRTSASTLYLIAVGSGVQYQKSTDNGLTWTLPIGITSGDTTQHAVGVWFDKWTSGGTGTRIHIAHVGVVTNDVHYNYLDTADDSQGSDVVVQAGTSATSAAQVSICKTRGGNLLLAANIDTGAEIFFRKSVDNGVNWTTPAGSPLEAANDIFIMLPANVSDNQDAWCIFWDISADEITLKTFDDSAGTWSENGISGATLTEVSPATANPQLSAVIRHSDGHALVAVWNSRDVATADLKTWDITDSGTITAKTDIVTNTDDCNLIHLYIDQATNNVYAVYVGKSDGSEVIGTTAGIYYKVSTDGMATWGSEQTLISTQSVWSGLIGSPSGTGEYLDVASLSGSIFYMYTVLPSGMVGMMVGQSVRRSSYY